MRRSLVFPLIFGLSGPVLAQSLEVGLSDDTARVRYSTSMWGQQYGRLELDTGLLYTADHYLIGHAGLLVYNDSWDSPLELGVGGRVYFADADDTYGGLALGGRFRFGPQSWRGLGIGGHFFYAPEIVSFGDAENLTDFGLRVDYELMPQARLFVAYQKLEAEHELGGDVEIEDSTTFGVEIRW